MTFEEDIR